MNSPKANLFLKIQTKNAADIAELKTTDLDTGQLDKENPPVVLPCMLVEFPETTYEQMQGFQNGKAIVRFKIATDRLQNTSEETPTLVKEAGLDALELIEKVYLKYQYWNADSTLADVFIRTKEEIEKRDDLRVTIIEFECTFIDASAG